jgi:hypothetical protein
VRIFVHKSAGFCKSQKRPESPGRNFGIEGAIARIVYRFAGHVGSALTARDVIDLPVISGQESEA